MIIGTIKLLSNASTAVWVVKTGYQAYNTGTTAYKTYKGVKSVKSKSKGMASGVMSSFNTVKDVLKSKR